MERPTVSLILGAILVLMLAGCLGSTTSGITYSGPPGWKEISNDKGRFFMAPNASVVSIIVTKSAMPQGYTAEKLVSGGLDAAIKNMGYMNVLSKKTIQVGEYPALEYVLISNAKTKCRQVYFVTEKEYFTVAYCTPERTFADHEADFNRSLESIKIN